jgi:Cu-Zn family superoxide dismutase
MKIRILMICWILLAGVAATAQAAEIVIDMHLATADGIGKKIGTITASETRYGTLLAPDLSGLSPGLHGFHLHAEGNCKPKEKDGQMVPGLAAGGHYDPEKTDAHKGPYGNGHLGDLPALYVDQSGKANHPVLAPRVRLADLKGRSLMIHAGGDNYADQPQALGGGGARVACGVFAK